MRVNGKIECDDKIECNDKIECWGTADGITNQGVSLDTPGRVFQVHSCSPGSLESPSLELLEGTDPAQQIPSAHQPLLIPRPAQP